MPDKSLKQLKAEGQEMTWEELQREGIKNRKQFLSIFPEMTEWVEKGEKLYGEFIGIASINFTDDRCVFLYKFANTYRCEFHNPANKKEEQNTAFALSYEAMDAFATLYKVFRTDEDSRRFWKAIGMTDQDIEEYLAQRVKSEDLTFTVQKESK